MEAFRRFLRGGKDPEETSDPPPPPPEAAPAPAPAGPPAPPAPEDEPPPAPSAPEEERGFRVLSDDELVAAVGGQPDEADEDDAPKPADAVVGGGAAAGGGEKGKEDGSSAEEEEWDCKFTYKATETYQPENVEGDPLQVNEYAILSHLGSGSFGAVKLCERRVGQPPYQKFAIKMMSRMRLRKRKQISNDGEGGMVIHTAEDMVNGEIAVMRHMYHRHVALLFEVIKDPELDNIYMVQEYLEGGMSMTFDPDTRRFESTLPGGGAYPEDAAAKLFFGLMSGLRYLHSKRVVHRDIKPENLLLTDGTKLRITDFGCAVRFKPGDAPELRDTAGTLSFLAPECCGGQAFNAYAADAWAAAVTLYAFVYGELPFVKDGLEPLLRSIREDPVPYPEQVAVSAGLKELLEGLLTKDLADRWGVDRALAHPWLDVPRREDEEEDKRKMEAGEPESAGH